MFPLIRDDSRRPTPGSRAGNCLRVYTAILTRAPGRLAETLPTWPASDSRKNIRGRGVVAECLADVNKAIDIAGSEHKAAPELKRVFPQAMLAMSRGLGAFAVSGIVLAQKVKQ